MWKWILRETLASDRVAWKKTIESQFLIRKARWNEKCAKKIKKKRVRMKAGAAANDVSQPASPFICPNSARDFKAKKALYKSHLRKEMHKLK